MDTGTYTCVMFAVLFAAMGIVFAFAKGRAAQMISGFNTLSRERQKLYDKDAMVKEMRNNMFLWSALLSVGALLSYYISSYLCIPVLIIWAALFFKDVHLDEEKAFGRFRLTESEGKECRRKK